MGEVQIPHNAAVIGEAETRAVVDVLSSGWIAQGEKVAALEEAFVAHHDGGSACALSSGSAAIAVALRALGSEPTWRIAVPTYACTALLNAVHLVGARPIVVDINPDTWNVAFHSDLAGVDAAILVAIYGAAVDLEDWFSASVAVVEDCCHSVRSTIPRHMESGTRHAAVFSFYASKPITSGQGGMIWSLEPTIAATARELREFDGSRDYDRRFNFSMTDIQAVIALEQMRRFEAIRARRRWIADSYDSALDGRPEISRNHVGSDALRYRYVLKFQTAHVAHRFVEHCSSRGIRAIVPIAPEELLHRVVGLSPGRFPVAEELARTTVSLPLHLGLSDGDVRRISEAVAEFAT